MLKIFNLRNIQFKIRHKYIFTALHAVQKWLLNTEILPPENELFNFRNLLDTKMERMRQEAEKRALQKRYNYLKN